MNHRDDVGFVARPGETVFAWSYRDSQRREDGPNFAVVSATSSSASDSATIPAGPGHRARRSAESTAPRSPPPIGRRRPRRTIRPPRRRSPGRPPDRRWRRRPAGWEPADSRGGMQGQRQIDCRRGCSRSVPRIRVLRCHSAAVLLSCGSAAISRLLHSGLSASRMVSTTSWCSWRFLPEAASAAPLAAFVRVARARRGPGERLAVTCSPRRPTSSSRAGAHQDAPANAGPAGRGRRMSRRLRVGGHQPAQDGHRVQRPSATRRSARARTTFRGFRDRAADAARLRSRPCTCGAGSVSATRTAGRGATVSPAGCGAPTPVPAAPPGAGCRTAGADDEGLLAVPAAPSAASAMSSYPFRTPSATGFRPGPVSAKFVVSVTSAGWSGPARTTGEGRIRSRRPPPRRCRSRTGRLRAVAALPAGDHRAGEVPAVTNTTSRSLIWSRA